MSWGAAGFDHAAVTRATFVGSAVTTVLWLAGQVGTPLDVGLRAGSRVSLYRVAVSHLVFSSVTECVLGYGLLYSFRVFERQRGSAKFLVHALTSLSIYTALELAATRLLPLACASGPYGHLFAMLPLFFTDVPCMARFTLGRPGTVLSVPLSDKVFTYAVAAHLALVRGWSSLIAAACGLAAGVLVCTSGLDADGSEREDDAGAGWFSITGSIVRLLAAPWRLTAQALASYGMFKGSADADDSTLTQTQAQAQRQQRQGVDLRQAAAGGGGGGGAGPSTAAGALRREADSALRRRRPTAEGAVGGGIPPGNSGGEFEEGMPEPDAGSLDMLCQMGFAPEEARMALLAGNGDVSVAANILLAG